MTKSMLIDAAHLEEVRVCVLENGKVEDFDFESSARKPLRGNIYLARITRVEPSLQAAFVEYGGNRHGFLAFNEIHPDYYQIPVSDRRVLQEAEAEEAALAAELELEQRGDEDGDGDEELDYDGSDKNDSVDEEPDFRDEIAATDPDDALEESGDGPSSLMREDDKGSSSGEEASADNTSLGADPAQSLSAGADSDDAEYRSDNEQSETDEEAPKSESAAKPSAKKSGKRAELLERYREARRKRARIVRNYKIQEVIKRRQILLIQVVKEERGNKGAALTTYLSLAGRYCVLMPNTARGGGISRKIPIAADRKRLRRVVDSLEVPQGMGLIIRTAGAKRTKAEIKRDYEYLIRLWENIRALTLKSIAPCLIYEEASLIKRAIRDLYDKDIGQVTVEGEAGYREAKDFMKMLMPSHAKNVQPYKDKSPLFVKFGVENQLDAMYQPTVRLKSGGYLVIHQTEALIAIDVNSGKATRERNIELTALKTNLEAAKEAARQCRLRDLAGLIVIDFIDMEENKNNRAVEKKLKDALKSDRARIQVGRISNFGLLEMSRQRRRSGIVDGTTHACPTCSGAGVVRSNEMAALRILRAIEGEAISARAAVIAVRASLDVTLYILNHKRDWLKRIEEDYALSVEIVADTAKAGDQYDVEKRGAPRELSEMPVIRADAGELPPDASEEIDTETTDTAEDAEAEATSAEGETGARRKRRRRRRRDDTTTGEQPRAQAADIDEEAVEPRAEEEASADGEDASQKKRRRRGRRGGRRNRRSEKGDGTLSAAEQPEDESAENEGASASEAPSADSSGSRGETDVPNNPGTPKNDAEPCSDHEDLNGHREEETASTENAAPEPDQAHTENIQTEPPARSERQDKPVRKGWWQKAIGG